MTSPTLPDLVPIRFRCDPDVAVWLVATWRRGFGDGNELADTLCKPLGNANLGPHALPSTSCTLPRRCYAL